MNKGRGDRAVGSGLGRFLRMACCLALLACLAGVGRCEGEVTSINSAGLRNGNAAVDPVGHTEGFSAVLYDNMNGLPTSEANAIAATGDGFLWIGSYAGLIRYDGANFVRMDSTSGLTSVKCLYVDSQERLWVGTNDNGAAVVSHGKLQMWGKKDGLRSGHIRAFAEDGDGIIYIASTSGVATMDRDMNLHMMDDPRIDAANVIDLRVGNDGLVYGVANYGDVFTLKGGKVITFLSAEENRVKDAISIFPDPEKPGYVYLGTNGSEIYRGSLEKNVSVLGVKSIAPLSSAYTFEYVDGAIWICAKNGIGVLDDQGFHKLRNLPVDNSVEHMLVDYEGNLWFTSKRQGVMKIVPNQFADIYDRYNLPEEVVNSTCRYEGMLLIATDSGLKALNERGKVERIPLTKAVTASGVNLKSDDLLKLLDGWRIRSVIRDSRGRLWISTWDWHGLLRVDHGELMAFTQADGLFANTVRAVCERGDGSILVAVTGGVNVIEGDRVVGGYGEADGIVNTETLSVAEGFHGDILVGSNGDGIYIIGDEGIRHLGTDEGLTSDSVMRMKHDRFRDLIWLVTGNSIAYLTGDYQVTTLQKFPYPDNLDLCQNGRDEIWVLSSDGIYVTPAEELLADEEIKPVHYGLDSGMPCISTANSYSELTEDGELYLCGTSGVAKVNIDKPLESVGDLKVAVPYLDADGVRVYANDEGEFTVDARVRKLTVNSFVFNYSLVNPTVTYHLEGFDQESVTVSRSKLTPVTYTNLPGGTYHFVMQVTDSLGHESKTVSIPITKVKAFYEQAWFYIAAILLIASVLAVGFSAYVRRKMRKLEKKHQEAAEKQRIGTELHMANQIQASMLPHEFPPFPDRPEFDIYAVMDPAKEVGGDFYDFFLIDDDHLCLVMADVSGKGVPAALFMMISKVIVQSCAMLGRSAAEILTKTNEALCSNNKVEMFVTVWVGILEISTGRITAANAGHEYPALMKNGMFALLKDKHGFVIGGMDSAKYREYEIDLKPGDKLFVYTDGVPEVTNADGELFGTERMVCALNEAPEERPEAVLGRVRHAVDGFVGDAEQFDDLTMLCLEYRGSAAAAERCA